MRCSTSACASSRRSEQGSPAGAPVAGLVAAIADAQAAVPRASAQQPPQAAQQAARVDRRTAKEGTAATMAGARRRRWRWRRETRRRPRRPPRAGASVAPPPPTARRASSNCARGAEGVRARSCAAPASRAEVGGGEVRCAPSASSVLLCDGASVADLSAQKPRGLADEAQAQRASAARWRTRRATTRQRWGSGRRLKSLAEGVRGAPRGSPRAPCARPVENSFAAIAETEAARTSPRRVARAAAAAADGGGAHELRRGRRDRRARRRYHDLAAARSRTATARLTALRRARPDPYTELAAYCRTRRRPARSPRSSRTPPTRIIHEDRLVAGVHLLQSAPPRPLGAQTAVADGARAAADLRDLHVGTAARPTRACDRDARRLLGGRRRARPLRPDRGGRRLPSSLDATARCSRAGMLLPALTASGSCRVRRSRTGGCNCFDLAVRRCRAMCIR